MSGEKFFAGFIRFIFLIAFGSFLYASIHHLAFFFHSFEQDTGNWTGSYLLAISIDVTALVLTTGVMFFRKSMPWYAIAFVWFFIIALTGFSWLVNWEYATLFQNAQIKQVEGFAWVNPIMASSFAFLNLAYALVSEFFGTKQKTLAEMEAEAERLEQEQAVLDRLALAKQSRRQSQMQNLEGGLVSSIGVLRKAAGELRGRSDEEVIDVSQSEAVQQVGEPVQSQQTIEEASVEEVSPAISLPVTPIPPTKDISPVDLNRTEDLNWEEEEDAFSGDHQPSTGELGEFTPYRNEQGGVSMEGGEEDWVVFDETIYRPTETGSLRVVRAGSVTFEEAAAQLGYSVGHIRKLRNQGRLRSPSRNKKLILSSSIESYRLSRQNRTQKDDERAEDGEEPIGNSANLNHNETFNRDFAVTLD